MGSSFKKDRSKIRIIPDIDMLLMFGKRVTCVTCYSIKRHVKASDKYMKDYSKNKKSSYLKYWDVIICMVSQYHKSPL